MTSSSTSRALAGAALAGAASGLRSQMGMAGVLLGVPEPELPPLLRHRAARPIAATLAAGELVADQYPSAPSRTQPSGLIPRVVLGGVSAGLLARRVGAPALLPAAVGSGAALGAAFAGLAARTSLARRLPPVVAALIEDLVAVALVAGAVRVTPPRASS